MKYSLKKVLALLLAAVIAISVFNASPAANVEAKSTKYKAGAVYVRFSNACNSSSDNPKYDFNLIQLPL